MTATNHTEHYGLSQYTEDDHPTYTGDYNGDMSKIDAAIYAASQTGGGGMATVSHTADLTGDGTMDSPLGVAETIARTEDIPSLDGYATTESVTQAIAAAIADRLRAGDIKAGSGINIETSGNQVTISYVGGGSSGGLAAVAHDATLKGDGTAETPLGVVDGTALQALSARAVDLNTCETNGFYYLTGVCQNTPEGSADTNGILFVQQSGYDRFQVLITSWIQSTNRKVYYRTGNKNPTLVWSDWLTLATTANIPDVSALTSRITALEAKVNQLTAAATPSATGLTAEQLDSQYSDGYNIVRVGTPTPRIETEVNPNE